MHERGLRAWGDADVLWRLGRVQRPAPKFRRPWTPNFSLFFLHAIHSDGLNPASEWTTGHAQS